MWNNINKYTQHSVILILVKNIHKNTVSISQNKIYLTGNAHATQIVYLQI